jgi:glyoxalase family protein
MDPELKGLHHITAITSDAAVAVRFYTGILGLKLIKKTVNFDDPTAYHLYFGDEDGKPGTILTFFDWGTEINQGQTGTGVTQHLAFTTKDDASLARWKERLEKNGVPFFGPFDRRSFKSIYLRDPDGLIVEIASRGNGKGYDNSAYPESLLSRWRQPTPNPPKHTEPSVDPGMRLQGLHHVTALSYESSHARTFYTDLLGLDAIEETRQERAAGPSQNIYGLDGGAPGTMIGFIDSPEASQGLVGIGTVHHIAFAVEDQDEQLKWRKKLQAHNVNVTQVLDRKYFKSIYFREPNGLLLEIATIPPGFTVDEAKGRLGMSLALPDWLESRRPVIEANLKPISTTA